MKIHFIASKGNLESNVENYRMIIDTVQDLGHTLTRSWVEQAYQLARGEGNLRSEIGEVDWKRVNKENIASLAQADIVIAEASARTFSVGYQVANAIQQKKPVLILTHNDALRGTFGSGLSSDILKNETYTAENVHDIITDFISENTLNQKDLRFNFFIDRRIHSYLKWASTNTGKTKAEIVRELLLREINKDDF